MSWGTTVTYTAQIGAFDRSTFGFDGIMNIDGGDGASLEIHFPSPIQIEFQVADIVITPQDHHDLQALIHQPGKFLAKLVQIVKHQLPAGFSELVDFIFKHGGNQIVKQIIGLFRPSFEKWKAEGCAIAATASPTVICDYLFRGKGWLHLIPGNPGKVLRDEVAKGHAACVASFSKVREAILQFCGGSPVPTTCVPSHNVTTKVAGPGLCCKMVGPNFHKVGDDVKVTDKKGHCGTCSIVASTSKAHPGRPVFKFTRGGQMCPSTVHGCCGLLTV